MKRYIYIEHGPDGIDYYQGDSVEECIYKFLEAWSSLNLNDLIKLRGIEATFKLIDTKTESGEMEDYPLLCQCIECLIEQSYDESDLEYIIEKMSEYTPSLNKEQIKRIRL